MSATTGEAPPDSLAPVFSAVITPALSIGPGGTLVLLAALALLNAGAAAMFWARGAWPVTPFLGLDVLLVWLAFRAYRRKARAYEEVRLTADELLVRRVSPDRAVQEYRFNPYWVRLKRTVEEEEGLVRLALTSHGRSLVVAHYLSPGEREGFARELDGALSRLRGAAAG